MSRHMNVIALVAIAGAACSGDGGLERGIAGEATGAISKGSRSSASAPPTTIHLAMSGGPHEGSYDVDATRVTCSHGVAEAGAWGNQFTEEGAKPSSVQLVIPDAENAANGTSEFRLTVTFGDPLTGTQYQINRIHGRADGQGTATIDDRGSAATVTIRGTTKDGVGIDATLECREMIRA